jgi:glycogen debranching enzyme
MNPNAPEAGVPPFYIPATSSPEERRPRTLKQGDTFAVFDHFGDLSGDLANAEGLYHQDTRYLSLLRIEIQGHRPLLLSSTVQKNGGVLTADLTNPDIFHGDDLLLPRDTIHLLRSKFLWESTCYETVRAHNYSSDTQTVTVALEFAADFRDIFEVRGHPRANRGEYEQILPANDRVVLRYTGLDARVRDTELIFEPPPRSISKQRAEWLFTLDPGMNRVLFLTVRCGTAGQADCRFVRGLRRAHRARLQASRIKATVRTSNEIFNELLSRSMADLIMLATDTPHGPYPYAGIPWFSTAFGRDGIITAIEMLAFDPALAKGVLHYLAATQARETDPARDSEPGKILHETRRGEMALLGEVPFGQYYGSVDSTPLFVMLAGLYWQRTGDIESIRTLWPSIRAALQWIDRYGDPDRDGFVEYLRKSANGLSNQGWKDSDDSVFHADGTLARGSIALCEVQAYVYAAKRHAAAIAHTLGEHVLSQRLSAEAESLRVRFEERFWLSEQGYYALALDGEKRPCRILASNAGHALFCGIAAADRAAAVAHRLTSPGLFSGWGIRTVGTAESRYNPMSYHNGSVWPHDNALIALGLARYGHMTEALKVLSALFTASSHMDLQRLPELFCGFPRKRGRGPTFYPVACSPQAWASATPFALLTAALGIQINARTETVRFCHPQLPDFIDEVELTNLQLGSSRLDVLLHRRADGVAVTVLEKKGAARVEVLL